jgi:hypothetical protein
MSSDIVSLTCIHSAPIFLIGDFNSRTGSGVTRGGTRGHVPRAPL